MEHRIPVGDGVAAKVDMLTHVEKVGKSKIAVLDCQAMVFRPYPGFQVSQCNNKALL